MPRRYPGTTQDSKFRRSKRLPSTSSPSSNLAHSKSASKLPRTSNRKLTFEELEALTLGDVASALDAASSVVKDEVNSILSPPPVLPSPTHSESTKIYMSVIQNDIDVHESPDLESKVLYTVEKSNIISCSLKQKILGVPWYKTLPPSSGWICGELPTDKAHVILHDQGETQTLFFPTIMLTDEKNANKRFDLEKLERRTISAQIVRLLIQCYGLHEARKIAADTLSIVSNMENQAVYTFEPTEFSDVEQDHLGVDGTPKKLTPFDIIPIMTRVTIHHSHPQMAALDCAEQVNSIARMRPSEWGYQEWGFEGEYGHRVLILDDLTRQQRTNDFVAAAGSGRLHEVEKRLDNHQYIDTMHEKMQYTALHAAADFGHLEIVKLLVERGFHKFIDMVDGRWNQTALHYAAQNGREDVVVYLLEKGADRHAKNKDGYLPRDIATIWKQFDVAVLLKEVPSEIPGFRVTTVSPKSVGLEWDEPVIDDANQAPITFYELSHRMKSSQQTHIDNDKLTLEWTRLPLIDYESTVGKRSPGRKYVFSNLLAASGHEFQIRCRNVCGWSNPSPVVLQYTPGCEPSPPSVPYLVKTSRTSIMVEWHPPVHKNGAGLSGYEIAYRRVGDDPKEDPGAHFRFIFQEMDKDGGGTVEKTEFVKALQNFGFKLTSYQVKRLCDRLDRDKDGTIDFKEFVEFCEESSESQAHAMIMDQRGGKNAEFDRELASTLKSELSRITMGTTAPKTKWETVSFHALQYCAKSFEKLVVYGMYEFIIRCKNSYGWSGYSPVGGPFKLIDGLWVTSITSRTVSLEWQKLIEIFPVMSYEVQMRELIGKGSRPVNDDDYVSISSTLTERVLTVDGLKPDTHYNFRVRPCVATASFVQDDDTHGEWRPWIFGIATGVICTLTDKPDEIGYVGVVEGEEYVTSDSLEINWVLGRDNGSRIIESEVRVMEGMNQWLPTTHICAGGYNRMVIPNLDSGVGYQFSVRCRNKHGWTGWSELSVIKETRGAQPPGKVRVCKENKGRRGVVAADSSWIMVEWDPPFDNSLGCPESYELQICNRNSGIADVWETCSNVNCTGTDLGDPNPDDCRAFVTNLRACVNYVFRVRSCTARGWSCWGEVSDEITTLGRF